MKKLAIILFTLLPPGIYAQKVDQTLITEFGVSGGMATYSGDLTPREFGLYTEEIQPAFGAFVRFHPIDRTGVRLAVNALRVSGDDANSANPQRGLNFRTSIVELSVLAEVEAFRIKRSKHSFRNYFAMYLFGGGSVYRFQPQALFEGAYVNLQPVGTEGQGLPLYEKPYRLTRVSIPFGVGLKYVVNPKFAFAVEFSSRKLFTDYLDDVGHVIINYEEIRQGKGEIAAQLSYPNWEQLGSPVEFRRGGEFDDWYHIGAVTFSYFLFNDYNRKAKSRSAKHSECYGFGKNRRRK